MKDVSEEKLNEMFIETQPNKKQEAMNEISLQRWLSSHLSLHWVCINK